MARAKMGAKAWYPPSDLRPTDDQALLWALRMLCELGGHAEFVHGYGTRNDRLASVLGIAERPDGATHNVYANSVRKFLFRQMRSLEKRASSRATPATLKSNLQHLQQILRLSDIEREVLGFVVRMHTTPALRTASEQVGEIAASEIPEAIAAILGRSDPDIRMALTRDGSLMRSGLITIKGGSEALHKALEPPTRGFASRMVCAESSIDDLLKDSVMNAPPPILSGNDYPQIATQLSVLRPYLRHALETRRPGVNVFIHGRPGTGKTELARVLAGELGFLLLEIASKDDLGEAISGEGRLRALRMASSFFAQQSVLLLFDEAEDVFNDGDEASGRKSTAQTKKAWINRMLEVNLLPTIWLSNPIWCMDPAFLRRFDMVIELTSPPRSRREQIIKAACGSLAGPGAVQRLAESDRLSPAVVTRAASVVRAVSNNLGEEEASKAIECLVDETLVAQRHHPLKRGESFSARDYDPSFVNVTEDLTEIAEGIRRSGSARLFLYGPPGTGKSAFGRWLADRIDLPIRVRRASDILSPFVGMTEENLARVFKEAESEGAVLLLDEADSFLRERGRALRTWEVSAVNEMLGQMESFGGVFVASTNLFDDIDQAALRRFDLKLHFGYLKPDQAWTLFVNQCEKLGLKPPPLGLRREVISIRVLTPGDFAAAARRNRFQPIACPEDLVRNLRSECAVKADGKGRAIGFAT